MGYFYPLFNGIPACHFCPLCHVCPLYNFCPFCYFCPLWHFCPFCHFCSLCQFCQLCHFCSLCQYILLGLGVRHFCSPHLFCTIMCHVYFHIPRLFYRIHVSISFDARRNLPLPICSHGPAWYQSKTHFFQNRIVYCLRTYKAPLTVLPIQRDSLEEIKRSSINEGMKV